MITIKEIERKIQRIQGKMGYHELLSDIFELSAITISNLVDKRRSLWEKREARFKDLMSKFSQDEVCAIREIFADIFTLLSEMSKEDGVFDDYLGQLYMGSSTQNKGTGQYFTPYSVSKISVQLSLSHKDVKGILEKDPNYIFTINEPTAGSGGMALAAIEELRNLGVNYANNALVVCSDIDKRCVHMCYLQLSLAGVPAIIYHQDTLTLETWDEWHTPAYCMNYIRMRKAFNKPEEKTLDKTENLPQNFTSNGISETSPTNTQTDQNDNPSEDYKKTLFDFNFDERE